MAEHWNKSTSNVQVSCSGATVVRSAPVLIDRAVGVKFQTSTDCRSQAVRMRCGRLSLHFGCVSMSRMTRPVWVPGRKPTLIASSHGDMVQRAHSSRTIPAHTPECHPPSCVSLYLEHKQHPIGAATRGSERNRDARCSARLLMRRVFLSRFSCQTVPRPSCEYRHGCNQCKGCNATRYK